jgi:hypothetical protein
MKNMKKLLQKAMVFTLAAAMLIGTPLSASAAGLVDLYKVVDNFGKDYGEHDPDNSATGTVTNTTTDTKSSVLDLGSAAIAGIMIKESDVELNLTDRKEETLTVVFVNENGEEIPDEKLSEMLGHKDADDKEVKGEEILASLKKRFTWRTDKNTVVSLVPNENGMTDTMGIKAKTGGRAVVTVELNDYANDIHYKASVNVSVEQWATDLVIDNTLLQDEAFAGDSLTLADYVDVVPSTAGDDVTFAIVSGSKYVTLKNGVLKLKTGSAVGQEFQIVAMGKNVSKKSAMIKINAANPAKTFEFSCGGKGTWNTKKNAYTWTVNEDGHELEFTADLKGKDGKASSDRIVSWTSKKPDVVAVKNITKNNRNGYRVKLVIADKVDKVQKVSITVKTSSGKTGTLSVDMKAYLTGLKKAENPAKVYSGQTVELGITQKFDDKSGKTPAGVCKDNFTDAGLTWEFTDYNADGFAITKKEMAKVAKLNKKTGVLSVNPSITIGKGDSAKKIGMLAIKVSNAKAITKTGKYDIGKGEIDNENDIITVPLGQVDITSITIYQNTMVNNDKNILIASSCDGNKVTNGTTKAKTTIAVDATRTFGVVAKARDEDGKEIDNLDGKPIAAALGWTVSNAKLANVTKGDSFGRVTAIKKGSPNIVISGSTKVKGSYKAIKATVKLNVTQPTKSITLTTKNKDIPFKKGSVSFKATLDKGTSTKAGDIKWTVQKVGDSEVKQLASGKLAFADADKKNSKGLYTALALPAEAGGEYIIKASVAQSGISRSIKMKLVEPTYSVEVESVKQGDTEVTQNNKKAYDLDLKDGKVYTLDMLLKKDKQDSGAAPGGTRATVTYTVNKAGYVYIYGNTIQPLQEGTGIKITPVSSDGKKGKPITVNIKVPTTTPEEK